MNSEKRTYTVQQAADYLQVTIGTVTKHARKGWLGGSKLGRVWRFTERDLEQYLERQRPTRPAEPAL
jgi:excisionase family DNA binding protein